MNVSAEPAQKKRKQMPNDTPTMALFRSFSDHINAFTDQRERIIKCSREITINSKKLIYTLQRLAGLQMAEEKQAVFEEYEKRYADIQRMFFQLYKDLQNGEDFYRFQRSCSCCLQEYIEAVVCYHYFRGGEEERSSVLMYQEFMELYAPRNPETNELLLPIPIGDFLLGVADSTGEFMRYCINSVGKGLLRAPEEISALLRQIYNDLSVLDALYRVDELPKKLNTLRCSLAKVEDALYTVRILQSEYPPEMLAEVIQSRQSASGASQEQVAE